MDTLIVPAKEFRKNFPKYQLIAEKGISLTIVKRSKPIFRIEPIDTEFQNNITEALIDYENEKNEKFVTYENLFK